MAPEVMANFPRFNRLAPRGYGLSIDVWALGLFMFHFLEGQLPFNFSDTERDYHSIKNAQYRFSSDAQRRSLGRLPLSLEAKDLIE